MVIVRRSGKTTIDVSVTALRTKVNINNENFTIRQLKVKTIKLHKAGENAGEQGKIGCSLILIGIC